MLEVRDVKSAAAGYLTSDWLGGMEFHEDCTQSILDAVEEYGCSVHLLSWERLGIGEGCADFCSLLTGEATAGGACRGEDLYHYPLSDCPAGLVCDAGEVCVDPCQAWFSDKLAEGGECERGWEVVGQILAGIEPIDAVLLQIVVAYMLVAAVTISSVVALELTIRRFFTAQHQLIWR